MANNKNNNRAPVKKKYGEKKAKRAIKYNSNMIVQTICEKIERT